MTFDELIKRASPLPWPEDCTQSPNIDGTTCAESNANDKLERHCVNNFVRLRRELERTQGLFSILINQIKSVAPTKSGIFETELDIQSDVNVNTLNATWVVPEP